PHRHRGTAAPGRRQDAVRQHDRPRGGVARGGARDRGARPLRRRGGVRAPRGAALPAGLPRAVGRVSATRAAITAADEEPHAPSTDLAWREAYAFDLHDAASGLAGFTRMTVRPNAGMMDAALSFFLPDGGFITARHVKP